MRLVCSASLNDNLCFSTSIRILQSQVFNLHFIFYLLLDICDKYSMHRSSSLSLKTNPKNRTRLYIGIKSALASNPRCPSCGSTDVDANRLIPNKSLRNSIQKYKDEHGDPDEQPTELPTTQEPTNAGNEEQEIPKDTEKVDNTPSNDDQAPNEAPQVSKSIFAETKMIYYVFF
jgi:hypothetical protein